MALRVADWRVSLAHTKALTGHIMNSQLHYALPAAVTLAALLLYALTVFNVGRARDKYKISAPGTTGHPVFDRRFRVQMNTLEQLVAFLPALWLFAAYGNPTLAAAIGALWIAGRVWYAIGYGREARRRAGGFVMAFLASTSLWLGAAWGVLVALTAG